VLAGCAKANAPELYRADPNLLEDQALNLPSSGSSGDYSYEIIQGIAIFEGDIVLGKVDQYGALPPKMTPRGLGRNDAYGRWPDGIVPYVIPENSSKIQKTRVAEAIVHWTSETNITFVERSTANQELYPNFIQFESGNSCASYVGMKGGSQPVFVSDACSVGSIIHEIGHALGFFHEHTRPDRDNFAQINWDEIISGKEINFDILGAGAQDYGPYDYGSIMHYGEYFFTATGEPTIVVPDGIKIGQRQNLSPMDIDAMNSMYATDLALFQPTLNAVDAGTEIGISIANQGSLGAQQVQLVAKAGNDVIWQGISADSGWNCATVAAELRCDRPTLQEQSESDFTLLLNLTSIGPDDISLILRSRTTDTDLSNNSFNDDADTETSGSEEPLATSPPPEQPNTVIPDFGAAEEAKEIEPITLAAAPTVATTKSASGGAINGFLAALAALSLVWQRSRKIRAIRYS